MKSSDTMTMFLALACLAAALFLSALRPALAGEESTRTQHNAQGRLEEGEVHQIATITAIDKGARTVTLTGEHGEKRTVDVPRSVKAFDKIKVGQKVEVAYYESMAVALDKPGAGEPAPNRAHREETSNLPATAEHGPGRLRVRQVTVTAQVVSVDVAQRKVTLEGPDGNSHTITVEDPALQQKLPTIQPGDKVNVTYTEAVAASLVPVASKQ